MLLYGPGQGFRSQQGASPSNPYDLDYIQAGTQGFRRDMNSGNWRPMSFTAMLTPALDVLRLVMLAPVLFIQLASPAVDPVSIVEQIPSLAVSLAPPAPDPLVLTRKSPSLGIGVQLSPGSKSLSFIGNAPSIPLAVRLSPGVDILAVPGNVAVLALKLTPGAGPLASMGKTPVIASKLVVPRCSISIAGKASQLRTTLAIPKKAVSVTGFGPVVKQTLGLSVPKGVVQAASFQPALRTYLAIPKKTLTGTGLTPSLGQAVRIPAAGNIHLTGSGASLKQLLITVPDSLYTVSHTVSLGVGLFVPKAALTATARSSTLRLTAQIPKGSVHFTGSAPALKLAIVVSPVTGTIKVSSSTASLLVSANRVLGPPRMQTVVNGRVPSVAATANCWFVVPKATLSLLVYPPSVLTTANLQVASMSGRLLVLTGKVPSLVLPLIKTITPASGGVSLAGRTLSLFSRLAVSPRVVVFSGKVPAVLATASKWISPGTQTLAPSTHAVLLQSALVSGTRRISISRLEPALRSVLQTVPGVVSSTGFAPSLQQSLVVPSFTLFSACRVPALAASLPINGAPFVLEGWNPAVATFKELAPGSAVLGVVGYAPGVSRATIIIPIPPPPPHCYGYYGCLSCSCCSGSSRVPYYQSKPK